MAKSTKKSADDERLYDVVVYGATGFTGELVAEYLAERYGDGDLRWALGGRNRDKLEVVRRRVADRFPAAAEVPLVTADSGDRASLDAMASQTQVVCTTVGPYARYGSDLVAACVAAGTDYCDLTGEVHWIRRMIDEHHEAAAAKGVRIVNCCGVDSIPSDLGTLLLQSEAEERFGANCERVTLFVDAFTGGFSGGSVASMIGVVESSKDPETRRVLGNPYSLNPEGEREGPDGSDQTGIAFDTDGQGWTSAFLMASVNTRVVRRSHALLGFPWGRDFRYAEKTRFKKGPGGWLKALGLTAGLGAFATSVMVKPLRKLLLGRGLPKPGEGPSRDKIDNGFFKTTLVGRSDDGGPALDVIVRGKRDPGYGATAGMLAESALCLALDREQLGAGGGVLTPATAMGLTLVERLDQAGMVTFEVVSA